METFGRWLYIHRKKADMTQEDVAKRAGISISYVSTIERSQAHSRTGSAVIPDREKVISIAKAVKGDVGQALTMCGYATENSDGSKYEGGVYVPPFPKKPRNMVEFLMALEALGLEQFDFSTIDRNLLDQYTADDFEILLERIKADIKLTFRKADRS